MTTFTRRSFLATSASAAIYSSLSSSIPHLSAHPDVRSASMWTYLWDLVDEGWTSPLQLMKENGLTHISLAAAYHAGRFLLPHNPKQKVYFLEDGTVYFSPTSSLYGRVKPIVNSLVKEGEDLGKLVRLAEKEGMGTNAWVVCCHNTPLGRQYPDIVCVNAFGDSMVHNLCPSNDDVRTYLKGIVKDIARQGAERIELEAMQFMGYPHGNHHERTGIALTEAQTFLLGLCFCPSCFKRSQGMVDLVAMQRYARTTLENTFASPEETKSLVSLTDLPQDLFQPFLEWRRTVVSSLAEELQEAVAGTRTVLRPLVSFSSTSRTSVGMDVARVAGITGGVLMPGYLEDGNALRQPLRDVQDLAGKNDVIVGFQVGLPESGGKQQFLSRLETAISMGVRDFNFYNYGLIHLQNLAWIKEGLV